MYLIYVDESGDPGISVEGTPFFVISGIIIHEKYWNDTFQRILDLRQKISKQYKIPQRIPFHASDIVNGHNQYHHSISGLTTQERFLIYKDIFDYVSQLSNIKILNVFIRKDRVQLTQDVFEWGWQLFIQRFNTFLEKDSQRTGKEEYGLLFSDRTQDDKLKRLLRRMRAFNYVPSKYAGNSARRILIAQILDDPIPRVSTTSYFIQIADLIAFSLARRDYSRASLNAHGFDHFFNILTPICLCEATQYDPQGIVYWPR